MAQTIRWGILGCGKIARKFASDLRLAEDAELTAIASRSMETAKAFAEEFPAKYVHDSYEALVKIMKWMLFMLPHLIAIIMNTLFCVWKIIKRYYVKKHLQ